LDASSFASVASASVNVGSNWMLGTRIRNSEELHRFLLASSASSGSGSETETELDFRTPPLKTAMKAGWELENKKMGEYTAFPSKTSTTSPPYDPFGPKIDDDDDDDDDDDEKKKQEKEDFQLAVYLDMDLNGHPQKAEAQKRIREIVENEEEEIQKVAKKKDRTAYWKQRYLKEKQIKTLRQTPHFNLRQHFIQDYFYGVQNIHVTMK
jgi:hypothetical protein